LVRRPDAAPTLPRGEIAGVSYGDEATCRQALNGIETVFMVSARESADRVADHRTFVDAAAAAGVRHVVYTSFYGATADAVFTFAREHWATEEHIRSSGMRWTFLRDNLYLDLVPLIPGPDDAIRGPAGTGRISAVAQDDIADVALAVLLQPGHHAGATYDLTGPEEFSLAEAAAQLSEATGRHVVYVDETLEEAYASRAGYGAPEWELDGWITTYLAIAAGELAGLSDAVERVTGHQPLALRDLLVRG
ncbi:MAG TPA: SDR family oxidoreductase, partial [Sporichthya sp.]|nr:SDR family oxidoreductase [Sporichthya sp.]